MLGEKHKESSVLYLNCNGLARERKFKEKGEARNEIRRNLVELKGSSGLTGTPLICQYTRKPTENNTGSQSCKCCIYKENPHLVVTN